MKNEFEIVCEGAVVVWFKALSRYVPAENLDNYKERNWSQSRYLNPGPPELEVKCKRFVRSFRYKTRSHTLRKEHKLLFEKKCSET
jgi:hypothetical protein